MDAGFATPDLNELVHQHNYLVRAPLRLSNIEARIFALCLACLHQRSEKLDVQVDIKDVVSTRGGAAYEAVREGCVGLTSKPVRVETTDDKGLRTFITSPLFAELKLEEGSGQLTGSFNEKLRQHLVQLREKYTRCEVQTLMGLKSGYAHKLYWVLKSWAQTDATVTIKLDELRDMLQGPDLPHGYPLWADFKRYVLEPARKELDNVSWPVTYVEEKVGKKVTAIRFQLPFVAAAPEAAPPARGKLTLVQLEEYRKELVAKSPVLFRAFERMQTGYKLTESQARRVCDAIASQAMLDKLNKALHSVQLDQSDHKPIKNLGAYTLERIKEALPTIYS